MCNISYLLVTRKESMHGMNGARFESNGENNENYRKRKRKEKERTERIPFGNTSALASRKCPELTTFLDRPSAPSMQDTCTGGWGGWPCRCNASRTHTGRDKTRKSRRDPHKWYKSIVGRSGKKIKGVARRESGGGRKTVAVAIQPNRIWNPASPPTTTTTQQATYPSSSSRNVTDKWAHEDGVGPVPGWTPCCMQLL